jgi:ZIP family zinc transporter
MKVPDGIPLGLIVVSGVDILVDGLTVGAGLSFGGHLGFLLAIGIAVELSLLGLTVARELGGTGNRWRPFLLTSLYAGVLLVGGGLGLLVLGRLPELATTEVLAFGAAALLYLVTEELLVEAHEAEDPAHNTLILFAGFIGFWSLRWVMPGS